MAKFVVVAEFSTSPADRDRVLEAGRTEAQAVHSSEPGCERFDVSSRHSDPGKGVFYEVFENEEAFDIHQQTPHFTAFFEAIEDIEVNWDAVGYTLVSE